MALVECDPRSVPYLGAVGGLLRRDGGCTCVDASPHYLALGLSNGSVGLVHRDSGRLERLQVNERGATVTVVRLIESVDDEVAVGTSSGLVVVFVLPSDLPGKNKQLLMFRVSGIHSSPVTALAWSQNAMKLFSGDNTGLVSCTDIDYTTNSSASFPVAREPPHPVVQLSYNKRLLVVATAFRVVTVTPCDAHRPPTVTQIGTKDRKSPALLGAALLPAPSGSALVFCARPGLRLWKAGTDGQVQATYMFRELVRATSHNVTLLTDTGRTGDRQPAASDLQFGRVLRYGDSLLVSYHGGSVYVMDVTRGELPAYHSAVGGVIVDVAVCGRDIYVLRGPMDGPGGTHGPTLVTLRPAADQHRQHEVPHSLPLAKDSADNTSSTPSPQTKDSAPTRLPDTSPVRLLSHTAARVGQSLVGAVRGMGERLQQVQENTRRRVSPQHQQENPPARPEHQQENPPARPEHQQENPPARPEHQQENPPARPQHQQENRPARPDISPHHAQPPGDQRRPSPQSSVDNSVDSSVDSARELSPSYVPTPDTSPDGAPAHSAEIPPIVKLDGDQLTVIRIEPGQRQTTDGMSRDTGSVDPGTVESSGGQSSNAESSAMTGNHVSIAHHSDMTTSRHSDGSTGHHGDAEAVGREEFEELVYFSKVKKVKKKRYKVDVDINMKEETKSSSTVQKDTPPIGDNKWPSNTEQFHPTDSQSANRTLVSLSEHEQLSLTIQDQRTNENSLNQDLEHSLRIDLDKLKEGGNNLLDNFQTLPECPSVSSSQRHGEDLTSVDDSGQVSFVNFDQTSLSLAPLDMEPTNSKQTKDDAERLTASALRSQEQEPKAAPPFRDTCTPSDQIIADFAQLQGPSSAIKSTQDQSTASPSKSSESKSPTSPAASLEATKSSGSIESEVEDFYTKYRSVTAPASPTEVAPGTDPGPTDPHDPPCPSPQGRALLADAWTDHPTPYSSLAGVCLTQHAVWVVDAKHHKVSFSPTTGHTLSWTEISDPASQLCVSPSGRLVWRLHRGLVSVATGVSRTHPAGRGWVEVARDIACIAVDDDIAWTVKQSGCVTAHPALTPSCPHTPPQGVPCPAGAVTSVCARAGVVWALSGGRGVIARVGVCEGRPTGWDWTTLSGCPPVAGIALGDHQRAWVTDTDGRVWFTTGVTRDSPTGDGAWWQVCLSGYLVGDPPVSGLRALLPAPRTSGSPTLTACPSPGLMAAGAQGVWLAHHGKLRTCRGNITGHRWEQVVLPGTLPSTRWQQVCVSAVDGREGVVWSQLASGAFFCFPPTLSASPRVLEVAPPTHDPATGTTSHTGTVTMATTQQAVWVITAPGRVYIRAGIGPHCPQGIKWALLNTTQLGSCRLVHLSCGTENVWAVDDRGQVYMRIGALAPTSAHLSPAWVPVDGCTNHPHAKFVKVAVGPDDRTVWCLDNKMSVYVRRGVCDRLPVGSYWSYVAGTRALSLCVSLTTVYALSQSGEVLARYGISEDNDDGDYWRRIPGVYTAVSVTADDELWAIDRDDLLHRRYTRTLLTDGTHSDHSTQSAQSTQTGGGTHDTDWELI